MSRRRIVRPEQQLHPEDLERLLREAERRAESRNRIDIGELCFPEQRAFVEDDSPFVAALCGRRAGKSDAAVLKCLRAALRYHGAVIPYIALSRPHAKRIAWPKLQLWDRKLGLGARFNHAELTMTIPRTGSVISLGGANDQGEIERYRGGAYPVVVLDEAQAFRPFIKDFILEILMPALLDYRGQIVLIGTPNGPCFGYFHDATNPDADDYLRDENGEPMFSMHRWTGFDNPNLDPAYREGRHSDIKSAFRLVREEIGKLSRAAGLSVKDPVYRREWLAEWVRDEEGLVYRVPGWAVVRSLPDPLPDDLQYVLGMDVGFVDATAFVVMAYSETVGKCWVVRSYQQTEMLPSQQVAEAYRLDEEYEFASIVVDPGGGGKGVVEELAQRHGLPAKVAAKREKVPAIETLNADMKAGTVRILRWANQDLLHDLSQLKWDYARLKKKGGTQWKLKPINHLAIDDRTPDHLADAFLYAHRECLHYINDAQEEAPALFSKEWIAAQEAELLAKASKKATGGDEGPWWEEEVPVF